MKYALDSLLEYIDFVWQKMIFFIEKLYGLDKEADSNYLKFYEEYKIEYLCCLKTT